VLAFARPEVHQLFPRLWTGRPLEEIRLSPLTRSAGERLVRAELGGASSDVIVERILEQADGVPFYLETLAQAAARGSAEVPAAVIGLVHARFEQLDAQTRRVLRAASVYGPTFWHGAVRALVGSAIDLDAALRTLLEQKLIAAQQDTRFPGEQAYDFATTLVRDSAYASLTDADRTLGHLLAADWLEHAGEPNAATISSHRILGSKRGSESATRHAAG
jgi:eukaryotic-like serine/threonine-protein kinase